MAAGCCSVDENHQPYRNSICSGYYQKYLLEEVQVVGILTKQWHGQQSLPYCDGMAEGGSSALSFHQCTTWKSIS